MAATVSIKESKTILEGNSSIQTLSFDIVLSEAITSPVQVPYQIGIATDTATIDEDYTVTFDPIVFNLGDPLVKTLSFQIIGDRIVETDEVFTITLGSPVGATLGTQITATGTILNDDILPNITIAAGANAKEPNTNGNFTLTRTGSTDLPLTVTLNYLGSTATVNTDYQTLPTLVTFAAGQTQAVINVTPIDDDLYEGTESVKANLVANSSYSIGAVSGAEISIEDNETLPTLTITSASPSIIEKNSGEPANNASFQIQLSGKSATEITVNYTTVNGTAIAGSDFTATSGQLTFAAGSTTPQTILVPITPDNIFEPDKTFTLQLSNAIGASISSPFTTTILNDDVLPTITIAAGVNAQEPNTNGTFILNRTGDTTSALTVNLATPMDTATNGVDFQTIATTATFAIGSSSTIVDVKPIDDDNYEDTETIVLALQAASTYLLGAATNAEISLIDNETIPTLTITPATQTIIEKNTGDTANNASFQVQLSGKSATAITVNYGTVNGTATAGSDFTPTSGQLTFAPGTITPQTILVPITPDNIFEPDETFSTQLTNPIGAIVGSPATVSILNDDVLPIITIAAGVNAQEPTTPGTFILNRTGDLSSTLTVNLAATPGTATSGIDFQTIATTAIFAAGSSSTSINVNAIDDDLYEGSETVRLAIQTGSAYTLGASTSAEIAIIDNETIPTLIITPTTQSIAEKNSGDPANSASFQVQLSGKSATAITVDYATINGSATAGSDFTLTNGQLIFAAGTIAPQTILVPITPDNTVEPDETFTLQLTNPVGAVISGSPSTVNILNDDNPIVVSTPVITITAGVNAKEPGTSGTFILQRTGDLTSALTVNLMTTSSSGTETIDYQPIATTAIFAAGNNIATVEVKPIDDDIYEGNEKVGVLIKTGSNYSIGSSASAEIAIEDNETIPTLTITPTTQAIAEKNIGDPANSASFQVQLSGKSATAITVDYSTINGTATSGSDFTATTGKLTFAPGSLSQTILVPIAPDNTFEPDETFSIQLTNLIGATISTTSATATIKNDDVLPTVSIVPINNSNLPIDQLPNQQKITLKRDGDPSQPLTIKYLLTKLISGKTQDTTTTVTFTAGQSTTAIPLTIDSTIIYRELEKDTITLINDPNYAIDSLSKPITISLTNNQTAPTISISDTEIIEGDSGTSNLRFTIRLSNPSAQTTSISYQTADGTATFSKDYTATNSTLVFAPKEIEKTIDIPIIGDKIIEKDENFILTLSNPTSGAILNKATATGLIKNNDKATVSVTVTDAQAGEPNNPGQFSINIDSATEIPIAIQYALTGTATAGTDYQALPGIVTISPGETSQLININVKDDNILEGTEVVQLKLQPSTDYQIANGKDTGIVSIADDEKALPNLITTSASIFKIENSASTGTTLKFRKLEHQAFCRNEISLFTVDDDNGTIGGIAPGQTGYQNAAIKRSQVIFATLSDSPVDLQLDGQIDRYINVETSDRIGFLMVVGSSIDEINQGTKADVLFSSPNANIGSNYTRIANQGTVQQLSWEDSKTGGDGDFNDLGLEVSIQQAPNIIGTEQQGTKDLIDLRSFTGQKTFDISISGDAYYKNTVGLYKVDDLDGKIDGLKFGDSGYLTAALKRTVTSGVKGDNLAVQLDGGSILAPFLIANNSVANVLAGATAPVYFGNTLGNADKVDHIRLLGDSKFAFEDLFGGGDKDFNDVILQISARP
jgi:Calx-beta domain/Domain of unknown function (DUF4114)